MTIVRNWMFGRRCHIWVWILVLLIVMNACQPTQSISNSTQSSPSPSPVASEMLATPSAVVLPPTFELPTTTPYPTQPVSKLTPNGPWLAYLRYGLTIVNQDGTGRTIQEDPGCSLGVEVNIEENPLNRLVIFHHLIYLIQPNASWDLIYRDWPTCHTDFTGDEKNGLLGSIYQSTFDASPELRIYELPSGKIRDHFPLMKCSGQCKTDNVHWWQIKWSPNGRYLAYPAILDGQSSDLYIYDTENSSIRRLTNGPDSISTIWWSPDSNQIITGKIHDNNYPYISSLWVVSVSDSETRLLYSRDENPYPQGILGWLDDNRFIVYDGTNLSNALDLPAYNIRVVNKNTSEVVTLFNGGFMAADLDQAHETVAFYASDSYTTPGYEGPGVYLISASDLKLHYLSGVQTMPNWNDEIALFLTYDPCENDSTGRKAFNYKGEWQCISPQIPPDNYTSPDGVWQIILQDGTWVKNSIGKPVLVSEAKATQIIWRLDSKGFFFIANVNLFYVSLPEIDIKIVDKYPGDETISYRWVTR